MFCIFLANVAIFVCKWWFGAAGDAWVEDYLAHDKFLVAHGEWWRLWTSTFVHPIFIHLAFNMLVHVQLGRVMERVLGSERYLVVYMLSGLGGAIAFQASSSPGAGMGASGAIYGIAGAYLIAAVGRGPSGEVKLSFKLLGYCAFFLFGDQVFAYLWDKWQPGMQIALSAHSGGLVSGLLLGCAMVPRPAEIAVRERPKIRVSAGLFVVLLAGAASYGFFLVPHRPEPRHRISPEEIKQLEVALNRGDFDNAFELWKSIDLGNEDRKRQAGYAWLFDPLMAKGQDSLARQVLDELLRSAEAELVALRREESKDPAIQPKAELFNEIAWYHALRGTDLDAALVLVNEALERLSNEEKGFWAFLPRNRSVAENEGTFINTRGWLHLRRGDTKEALDDLEAAARIAPVGPNFVYLGLAQNRLGHLKEAREAAKNAEAKQEELSAYERVLLHELKDSLGEG